MPTPDQTSNFNLLDDPLFNKNGGVNKDIPSLPSLYGTEDNQNITDQNPPLNWQDIGKSGVSGAANVPFDIVGGPADIAQLAHSVYTSLIGRTDEDQEKIDMEEDNRVAQQHQKFLEQTDPSKHGFMYRMFVPDYDAEARNSLNKIPTTSSELKNTVPDDTWLSNAIFYSPETPEGQWAKSTVETTGSFLPGGGGVLGALKRGAVGLGASQIGQSAASSQKGSPFAPYAEPLATFVGALATEHGLNTFRNAINPNTIAEQEAANFLRNSKSTIKQRLNIDPNEILSTQTPVAPYDLLSDDDKKAVLQMSANVGKTGSQAISDYNAGRTPLRSDTVNPLVSPQAEPSKGRIKSFVENIIGKPLDAPALKDSIEQSNKVNNKSMYDLLSQHPNAQSIYPSDFGTLTTDNDYVKKAMKTVADKAETANQSFLKDTPMQVPRVIPEVPPSPILGPNGERLLNSDGTPMMSQGSPAREIPGNIIFWDQVKQQLWKDRKLNAGDPTFDTNLADKARSDLTSVLDQKLPSINVQPDEAGIGHNNPPVTIDGYKNVRDKAGEGFGQETAPEAGQDFYGKMDQFNRNDAIKNYNNMSNEQKELFAHGYLGALYKDINEGKLNQVANGFLKNTNGIADNTRMILGDENYHALRGKILSENLINQTKALNSLPPTSMLKRMIVPEVAGAAALASNYAPDLLHNVLEKMLGAGATPEIATAAAGVTGGFSAYNVMQNKRIADRVIPLLLSSDPKNLARLSKMADVNPKIKNMYKNINNIYQSINASHRDVNYPYANGGRIGRKSGGRIKDRTHHLLVNRLVTLANKAKKQQQKKTEPLLNEHDNTVAKALDIANQAI